MNQGELSHKEDIRNLSCDDLKKYLEVAGEKSFRAAQIFEWLYQKNAWSFDEMSNLPKPLRERLARDFRCRPFVVLQKKVSA